MTTIKIISVSNVREKIVFTMSRYDIMTLLKVILKNSIIEQCVQTIFSTVVDPCESCALVNKEHQTHGTVKYCHNTVKNG